MRFDRYESVAFSGEKLPNKGAYYESNRSISINIFINFRDIANIWW